MHDLNDYYVYFICVEKLYNWTCWGAFHEKGMGHAAGKHLWDMYREIREGVMTDYRQWLMEDHLWELQRYLDRDDFKMKAQKVKASRVSTKGGLLHASGSTTTEGTKMHLVLYSLYALNYI